MLLLNCLFFQTNATVQAEERGQHGMVVSSEKIATGVGIDILKQGGNAVDAAVAVGYALAVTYPTAGNLGGGGFMVIRFPDGSATTIDLRETAPKQAFADMYLDQHGDVIEGKSTIGYLACGVPGSVAGLNIALEKYGTKKLKQAMKPALELAKKGFPVSHQFFQDLKRLKNVFEKFPSSAKVFLKNNGEVYEEGEIFKQPDLYRTLKEISQHGSEAFYQGKIARLIVKDMKKNNGIICIEDLNNYQASEQPPVIGRYTNYEIMSMGLPSSGGIALIQSLNILENYDLKRQGFNSSNYIHLLTEVLRHVFALRAQYLGDDNFVNVPLKSLLSQTFADSICKEINLAHAQSSDQFKFINPFEFEGNHTTHYNVVDKNGMAVAVTTTINSGYGSKAVVEGAGFLLNNEMDDFAVKTGAPNIYGLVAYKSNIIEPNKRMLSSMSPTIITKDGDFFMAVGGMGGPKIITATLQAILNVIQFDMPLSEAIDAPRMHFQWMPDNIFLEKIRFPNDVIDNLIKKGQSPDKMGYSSEVTAILFEKENRTYIGACDFRWNGFAKGY